MTDAEVNEVLQRFDQTEPDLQRRIVVRLVEKLAKAQDDRAALLALCNAVSEQSGKTMHKAAGQPATECAVVPWAMIEQIRIAIAAAEKE